MTVHDLQRWLQKADGTWARKLSYHIPDDINATKGALDAAQQLGVNITLVKGTGKNGRITKQDVENA